MDKRRHHLLLWSDFWWPDGPVRLAFSVLAVFSVAAVFYFAPAIFASPKLSVLVALLIFAFEVAVFEKGFQHWKRQRANKTLPEQQDGLTARTMLAAFSDLSASFRVLQSTAAEANQRTLSAIGELSSEVSHLRLQLKTVATLETEISELRASLQESHRDLKSILEEVQVIRRLVDGSASPVRPEETRLLSRPSGIRHSAEHDLLNLVGRELESSSRVDFGKSPLTMCVFASSPSRQLAFLIANFDRLQQSKSERFWHLDSEIWSHSGKYGIAPIDYFQDDRASAGVYREIFARFARLLRRKREMDLQSQRLDEEALIRRVDQFNELFAQGRILDARQLLMEFLSQRR